METKLERATRGLCKATCKYMHDHEICDYTEEERRKFKCMGEDGFCRAIILDSGCAMRW